MQKSSYRRAFALYFIDGDRAIDPPVAANCDR
jgi:hypothetical protein